MKILLNLHFQFLILCLIWFVVGIFGGPIIYFFLPVSLLFLKHRGHFLEIFLGFWFILILSDSREPALLFTSQIKPVYLLILTVFIFFDRKQYIPFNKLYIPFIPFFIYALILSIYSESFLITFQKTISYILLFLIVPNYCIKLYKERGVELLKGLIYLGIIMLTIGVLFSIFIPTISTLGERFRGVFGNPNGIGLFCTLFFLLFSLIISQHKDLFNRLEKIIVYGLIFVSVGMSGSRTAMICIVLFFIFSRFYKISPLFGFALLIVVIISYQYVMLNLEAIVQSLGIEKYLRAESMKEASGRYLAWKYAWYEIQNVFYFGKGFAYDERIFEVTNYNIELGGHQGGVHNTFISFWLNTGIIGLILYFSAFVWSFIKASKNSILAFPILFSVLFSITYESWLMASLNPFTIILIIILTLLLSKEFNEQEKPDTVSLH